MVSGLPHNFIQLQLMKGYLMVKSHRKLGTLLFLVLVTALFAMNSGAEGGEGAITPTRSWESFTLDWNTEKGMLGQDNPVYDESISGASSEVLKPAQVYRTSGGKRECVTCDSDAGYSANYHANYTADGEHIVYISTRDRAGDKVNKGLLTFGGEVYIMDRFGKNKTRLTFLEGYARAPMASKDKKRVYWTQVTSDHRWHLLFADLIDESGKFKLGDIKKLTILPPDGSPPSAYVSNRLAWQEWKTDRGPGDWFLFSGTYGGTLNVDLFAWNTKTYETLRLTSHPENEEWGTLDPTGRGMVVMSGRAYRQTRMMVPLTTPPFNDYFLIIMGLVVSQTARAVPWSSDLYYMGADGENGMIKLTDYGKMGHYTWTHGWTDPDRLKFRTWRLGLAEPEPGQVTNRYGYINFLGRPKEKTFTDNGGTPAFLRRAALEKWRAKVEPFDTEDLYPVFDTTIEGEYSGTVHIKMENRLTYARDRGKSVLTFDNFRDGDYSITGKATLVYDIPANLARLSVKSIVDFDYISVDGHANKMRSKIRWKALSADGDVVIEREGCDEHIKFKAKSRDLGLPPIMELLKVLSRSDRK